MPTFDRIVGVDEDDQLPEPVRARLAQNLGDSATLEGAQVAAAVGEGITAAGVHPQVDALYAVGTSIVDMAPWETLGPTILSLPVDNGGLSGYGPADIELAVSALDAILTITGGSIPASGGVTVSAVNPSTGWRTNGTGAITWVGIATVVGTGEQFTATLRHNQAPSESWLLTRSVAGSVIAAPNGVRFHVPEGESRRGWAWYLDPGRNLPGSIEVIQANDRIARAAGTERVIVAGTTTSRSEGIGAPNEATYRAIVAQEPILESRFGRRFLNQRVAMRDRALKVIGITPTPQDRIDIAADKIPTSLYRVLENGDIDTLHFTQEAGGFQVQLGIHRACELGFFIGKVAGLAPTAPTAFAVGTPTETTLPLSWVAASGATAYSFYYRPQGATTWVWAGGTTGLSATISGLNAGSNYDVAVQAHNIAGDSPLVTVLNVATAGTPWTVKFSDTFNRADATLANSTATPGAEGAGFTWGATAAARVVSNQVGRVSADTSVRYGPGPNVGNREMRTEVTILSTPADSSGFGVMVAYLDANNYAYAYATPDGSVTIGSRVSGQNGPQTGSAAGVLVAGDRLSVSLKGDIVTAYVNDVEVASRTVTGLTGTYAGLRLPTPNTFRGDEFKVYAA